MGVGSLALADSPVQPSYAVVWRDGERVAAGKLTLRSGYLRLEGAAPDGRLGVRNVDYDEIGSVRVDRTPAGRVRDLPALVLELRTGDDLRLATVETGALAEVADVLATVAADAARGERLVVVVPLRRGASEKARELIEQGPPFDPEKTQLERHEVFLTESEVVFVFEGPRARQSMRELVGNSEIWRMAAAWRSCLGGRPHVAEGLYAWTRRDREHE